MPTLPFLRERHKAATVQVVRRIENDAYTSKLLVSTYMPYYFITKMNSKVEGAPMLSYQHTDIKHYTSKLSASHVHFTASFHLNDL